jgi:hypothetical protein
MEHLRRTNRLSTHLESKGYEASRGNHALAEAELASLTGSTTAKSADPFSFLSSTGLDFHLLMRVMTENYIDSETRSAIVIEEIGNNRLILPHSGDTSRFLSEGEKVDVLWISAETFVTSQDPIHGLWGLRWSRLYSITVDLLQHRLELHAYSFDPEGPQHSRSETPLRFFRHLLMPIFHFGPSIVINFLYDPSEPPVDASLALVPTTDQFLTNEVTICFVRPTHAHMRALASHRVHRRVCLCLEIGDLFRFSEIEMNHYLLGFRQPVHLRIPYKLNFFNGEEEPFVANPALVSLTIQSEAHPGYLSKKMIDGIAKNANIKSLSIDCEDWGFKTRSGGKVPEWVVELFRCVVLPSSSLECLVFVANRNWRNEPKHPVCRQAAFDQLTRWLMIRVWDSDKHCYLALPPYNAHSVSIFQLRSKPPIKSNAYWDSALFSPALVLNCLHRQVGGNPPGNMATLAVQRINQGVLYSFATNLIPCDLSASSAGVIFDILRSGWSKRRCASADTGKTALSSILRRREPLRQQHHHSFALRQPTLF